MGYPTRIHRNKSSCLKKVILLFAFIAVALASFRQFPLVAHNETAKAIPLEHELLQYQVNERSPNSPYWTLFKQCDARWGSHRLGTCSLTLCQAGCAMSDVAMMLNSRGVNTNPDALNSWLLANGGYESGCDIVWSKVDAYGKSSFQGIEKASESAICTGIAAGHAVIANVNGGEHWVLLTGCRGGGVFSVNDPGFNKDTYTMSEIIQEAVYH